MNAPDSDTPSEAALKAARDIFWGSEWPGGPANYPDDLEEIIDMARTIDRYTRPNCKPYEVANTVLSQFEAESVPSNSQP